MLENNIEPRDIRNCSVEDLENIAGEIRGKIIDVCAGKGGHLASSLGAVELIVALHYVLNTPEDLIVFDVGHQAYAHKLLTGRASKFSTIREYNGMSGFPNIYESEYDSFTVGHASNAVSLALGAVCANRINNSKAKVVAVMGDGSMSGGEAFEGLNNAGHLKEDITVVFNHNDMSISKAVGAFSNYFNEVQSSPLYNRARSAIDKFLEKHPRLERIFKPRLDKLKEIIKGAFVPGIFFEELGFRYFGPFDGHDMEHLVKNFEKIIDLPGPKLIHVITKKGKGFTPAEKDSESFHSAGKFCKESGSFLPKNKNTYTSVFGKTILELAKENKNIVALTAAMEGGTGLTAFAKENPDRIFDVGIAEQHLVSFAGGLNRQGLKPVVAVYSTFLQRAYDQLMQDVALQGFSPVFCLDRAGLVGPDGATHHGVFDIAYMRTIPNFVVMAPAYAQDLEEMLKFATSLDKPSSIRYAKAQVPETIGLKSPVELGCFEIQKDGKDLAILALGTMLDEVLSLEEEFKSLEIEPIIVNPRFVKPLDEQCLRDLVQKTNKVLVIEEGSLLGGFGEAVTDFYNKEGLLRQMDLKCLGIADKFITFGTRQELLKECGIDREAILEEVKKILKK